MNISTKLLKAAAGQNAGGATLDVDDCFSCFLYTGNGSSSSATQTITNGIDLTEGGLIWTKYRSGGSISTSSHALIDTERGGNKELSSDLSGEEQTTSATQYFSFNNNGYTINSYYLSNAYTNLNNADFVSWTFRKAPKFFDVQTVTTDSSGNATVNHNLGSSPGFVMVKGLNVEDAWYCFHTDRGVGKFTNLNNSDAEATFAAWTNVSSTSFGLTFGSSLYANKDMILYLFAHNNNDGGFGPDGDQDIIKCGSFTDSSSGFTVNLGFEPQFLLTKRVDSSGNWEIVDTMRGFTADRSYTRLYPNLTNAEQTVTKVGVNSTGFFSTTAMEANGATIIYMAIRRGPLAVPTDATKVFSVNATAGGDNKYNLGFVPDFNLHTRTAGTTRYALTRLLGQRNLQTNNTNAQSSVNTNLKYWDAPTNTIDLNTAWWGTQSDIISWSWARARGYFECTAYSGTGSTRTINHNLSAVPEMIWWKERSNTDYWIVYHKDLTSGSYPSGKSYLFLNDTSAASTAYQPLTSAPTSSVLSLSASSGSNGSGETYIAYLFATAPGVSKVSSVVHSGTTNVDAGFSNGSRFVLLKRTDAAGDWLIWDGTRGIVSGNDPYLALNSTAAEVTNTDYIDPLSSGFTLTSNLTAGTYVYYAIA